MLTETENDVRDHGADDEEEDEGTMEEKLARQKTVRKEMEGECWC